MLDLEQAFWKYVGKRTGCWNWKASVGNHGYGQLTFLQQKYTAHRLSWELNRGPIPDGLCVLHHCDNRRCVNPDHLFLGTRAENLVDMTQKGRRARGASHGRRRLTESQVKQVLASNESVKTLAQALGVTDSAIYLIKNRQRWAHLEASDV
jgi:HNH endonuclease